HEFELIRCHVSSFLLSQCAGLPAHPFQVSSCLRRIGGFMPADRESERSSSLNARLGEARCARGLRTLAQVEPPGRGEAERVEGEIDDQRELRATGQR